MANAIKKNIRTPYIKKILIEYKYREKTRKRRIGKEILRSIYSFGTMSIANLKTNMDYKKRSNLSLVALQIGHISGGASLAHKYPHTLHRHIG